MTRIQSAPGIQSLQSGVGVLLALMVLMTIWLGRVLFVWGRHVRNIQAALGTAGRCDMPVVPRTGERELDRIIDALNDAGQRLADARRDAEAMTLRMARAERLAGLGRVAAGVAHEIRNPIAAARLQGENALAGDDDRRRTAIGEMLHQLARLDALVGELLAMTQRVEPKPVRVDLAAFLAAQALRHKEIAAAKQVVIATRGEGTATLDPAVAGRVLDNLLTNAIRHVPEHGTVLLVAERSAGRLCLTVEDTGPGVPPDMAERLFEPFVTGRADGTGLGLAIARELTDAHGGRLPLRRRGGEVAGRGAVFAMTLPQEESRPQS